MKGKMLHVTNVYESEIFVQFLGLIQFVLFGFYFSFA
jgi:hypothetical protein